MRLLTLILPLFLNQCFPDETLTGYGATGRTWVLQAIDDAPVTAATQLRFKPRGRLDGQAPCRVFRARISLPYPWFALVDLDRGIHTSCADQPAEDEMFAVLSQMTLAEIVEDTMLLTNDDSTRIMHFVAE